MIIFYKFLQFSKCTKGIPAKLKGVIRTVAIVNDIEDSSFEIGMKNAIKIQIPVHKPQPQSASYDIKINKTVNFKTFYLLECFRILPGWIL